MIELAWLKGGGRNSGFLGVGAMGVARNLGVRILHRPGERHDLYSVTERHSADFLVDGRSLHRLIADAGDVEDLMGPFVAGWDEHNARMRDVFLLRRPSDLWDGRVMLFICPECGDIDCGAITMEVEREGDAFLWQRFAYEDGLEGHVADYESYAGLGPYRFDREEYEAAIRRASGPLLEACRRSAPEGSA